MKKQYLKNCLKLVMILAILGFPSKGNAQTYNFEGDATGSNPANVTVVNGTFTLNSDSGRTNTITPLSAPAGKPATANMDLFPSAKDYSVTWKETYTIAGVTCFTLRGFGNYVAPNQYQGYGFQVKAAAGFLTIVRFDKGGFATIENVALTAPGINTARWYRATVNGALLTFEYSDDSVNYTTVISTIEDVYPSTGLTQLTRGYLSPIAGTYIDDVVFTPITTTSKLYDFESDIVGAAPANVTVANGTLVVNNDIDRTNTMQVMTANIGTTASFDLNSIPSASDYSVIWKETYSTAPPSRSGMILRANGGNTVNPGLKQGYLFQISASQGNVRIFSVTPNGFTSLANVPLIARTPGQNRWYRAVVNGSNLSLEYSDNGRKFSVICTATDNTYTSGTTQYVQGFSAGFGTLFVDNIVFTPAAVNLSVAKNELKNFTLYPNPASATVNLLFDNNNGETTTVAIYDIQGRLVKKIENKFENNASIDVSSLRQGVYFLKIKSASAEQTKKLIIN